MPSHGPSPLTRTNHIIQCKGLSTIGHPMMSLHCPSTFPERSNPLATLASSSVRLFPAVCLTAKCLMCHTTDIACCVRRETFSALPHSSQRLLCDTADKVCCVTKQPLFVVRTLSAVSPSRRCLPCHTADTVCRGIQKRKCLPFHATDIGCCVMQQAANQTPTYFKQIAPVRGLASKGEAM